MIAPEWGGDGEIWVYYGMDGNDALLQDEPGEISIRVERFKLLRVDTVLEAYNLLLKRGGDIYRGK